MHVKICGLTNLDDALAAIDAGADLLGFNFYPESPRRIAPDECRRICATISNYQLQITTVGIFVNEPHARVAGLLDHCGLNLAQLHGDEPVEHLRLLAGRAFKGIRGAGVSDFAGFASASPGHPSLLLDSYSTKLYGGTGETADWSDTHTVAERFPILLAGGLNPDNVRKAIAQVRPWGVDTASGVESSPGRKDHAKVRAFVKAAQEAQQSLISRPSGVQSPLEIRD